MKKVIVGAGNVGIQLAKRLIEEHHDVVLVDRNLERLRQAAGKLDCMVVHGEANNREVLKKAQIEEADFFISVTESDELNMIACGMVAGEFNVPYKIARVRNFDYSSSPVAQNPFLGIDYVVNPEIEAARAILRSVEHGAISDIINFEGTTFQMRTMVIDEKSKFRDKRIEDVKEEVQYDFIVVVIIRENGYIIPQGDTVIRERDTLYLIGQKDHLETAFHVEGKPRHELKKVVIIGGGRIGRHVAKGLMVPEHKREPFANRVMSSFFPRHKRSIAIVENDYDKCQELSEMFHDALVIQGDISDEGILEENNLTGYDLLITTTGNQELNLLTSTYAKSLGIKRSIALVKKNDFLRIASKLSVDTTVSLNNTVVNSIIKLIRKGNVRSIHAVSGGALEVIELTVQEGSKAAGKYIKNIKMPYHALIVFISRGEENYLPHGNNIIQAGDTIVIITRKEYLQRMDELFSTPSHKAGKTEKRPK
ncbi:MAG: Trk system potassium transporter TrkA [Sediminispirochaetaceae bacterium]